MAILETELGIKFEIIADDDRAEEYQDNELITIDHDDPMVIAHHTTHTVAKYIEAVEDEPFSIKLSVGPPYTTKCGNHLPCSKLAFEIHLDTSFVDSTLCETCSQEKWRQVGGNNWRS